MGTGDPSSAESAQRSHLGHAQGGQHMIETSTTLHSHLTRTLPQIVGLPLEPFSCRTWAMHRAASMPVHSCDRSSGRGVASCGTTRDCRWLNAPAASCAALGMQPSVNEALHPSVSSTCTALPSACRKTRCQASLPIPETSAEPYLTNRYTITSGLEPQHDRGSKAHDLLSVLTVLKVTRRTPTPAAMRRQSKLSRGLPPCEREHSGRRPQ